MSRKTLIEALVLFGLFLILSIVLTLPGALTLSTHLIGDGGDGFQNVWNMWWMKTALVEQATHPYSTNYLHHPHGASLLFQTLNPFNGLLALPLQFLFEMPMPYNLVLLFSFAASGVTMYYLARHLTGHRGASFVAGVIFAFCPYHFGHGLGHMQLIATEWIPLFVLMLLRARERPGWWNAVGAGLALVLNALCSWYYLVFCAAFTALYLFALALRERRGLLRSGFPLRLVVVWGLFLVLLSPLLGAMVQAKRTQQFHGAHDPMIWSADLESFFVPGPISTWGRGGSARRISGAWTGGAAENSNYIGFLVLGLSIYAFRRVPRARFWAGSGFVFLVLSLGPALHVGGRIYESVPLPYRLLHDYLPLFDFMGVPGRFDVMLSLCLAVLASFGVSHFVSLRFSPRQGSAVCLMLAGLIAVEYLAVPFPTFRPPDSEFYRRLAEDPERYAVIDVDLRDRSSLTLYYATIHRKPLVGGYVSRTSVPNERFVRETPIIGTLLRESPHPEPQAARRAAVEVFQRYGVRYVISRDGARREFIENILELPLVFDDGYLRAYEASH